MEWNFKTFHHDVFLSECVQLIVISQSILIWEEKKKEKLDVQKHF